LKATVDVFAANVPLFVQSPPTPMVDVPIAVSVKVDGMVMPPDPPDPPSREELRAPQITVYDIAYL
jgi:hypothetical protein